MSTESSQESQDIEAKRGSIYTRRKNIINEILQTERSYVKHLQTVVELYMIPLRGEEKDKIAITEEQYKVIFSDVEVILRYNSVFLESLEKRVGTDYDPQTVKLGDVFIMIADYLKVYTRYINNYNDAHWALKELAENKDFVQFLNSRKENPKCEYKDLDDFLIMPVQRIPRYNLLLIDLVKNTPEDHPDYSDLCKAKGRISEIAMFVNEQKRIVENLNKVGDIIAAITGLDIKFKLLSPTRRFIREGELTQTTMDPPKKKQFYFFLFNDLLIWTTKKNKQYIFKKLHYLVDLNTRLGFVEGKPGIGIQMDGKPAILSDKTDEGTDGWFNDFTTVRAEVLEKENFAKIEKRKTFIHDELIQHAQGKNTLRKPAFAKIFKERDSKDAKEIKESAKDLRESRELKDIVTDDKKDDKPKPMKFKEKAMTIAARKGDILSAFNKKEKRRSFEEHEISTPFLVEKSAITPEELLKRSKAATGATQAPSTNATATSSPKTSYKNLMNQMKTSSESYLMQQDKLSQKPPMSTVSPQKPSAQPLSVSSPSIATVKPPLPSSPAPSNVAVPKVPARPPPPSSPLPPPPSTPPSTPPPSNPPPPTPTTSSQPPATSNPPTQATSTAKAPILAFKEAPKRDFQPSFTPTREAPSNLPKKVPQPLRGTPVQATPLAVLKPVESKTDPKESPLQKQDSKSFMGIFKSRSESPVVGTKVDQSKPPVPSPSAVAAEVLSRSRSATAVPQASQNTKPTVSNPPKDRTSNSANTAVSESPVNNAPLANASDELPVGMTKRRSYSAS